MILYATMIVILIIDNYYRPPYAICPDQRSVILEIRDHHEPIPPIPIGPRPPVPPRTPGPGGSPPGRENFRPFPRGGPPGGPGPRPDHDPDPPGGPPPGPTPGPSPDPPRTVPGPQNSISDPPGAQK